VAIPYGDIKDAIEILSRINDPPTLQNEILLRHAWILLS
jgi:hypothetical protein